MLLLSERNRKCDDYHACWVLQGQFLRKVARLSTQQSECGEKLEAIKLMDCAIYAYTSYTGIPFHPSWKILKQFCQLDMRQKLNFT